MLTKIYKIYFQWEIQICQSQEKIQKRSQKALFQFLKEFNLCPALLSKSLTYSLFIHIIDLPPQELTQNNNYEDIIPFRHSDLGQVFTLSKFFTMLVRVAIISYSNNMMNEKVYEMS